MDNVPIPKRSERNINGTAGENASRDDASSRGRPRYRALDQPAWGRATSGPRAATRHEERRYFHFQAGRGLACVAYCWNRA